MRPLRTRLLLLVAVAIVGVCAPSASSGPGPQVLRLIWVQTSSHPGKSASWTSKLLNAAPQFGRPIGAKVGAEVGVTHGPQLIGGIKLPGGVLEYSGKPKHVPHGGIVVPVVDGSGIFAGVSGTYTRSKAGDKIIVVLRLQYD